MVLTYIHCDFGVHMNYLSHIHLSCLKVVCKFVHFVTGVLSIVSALVLRDCNRKSPVLTMHHKYD